MDHPSSPDFDESIESQLRNFRPREPQLNWSEIQFAAAEVPETSPRDSHSSLPRFQLASLSWLAGVVTGALLVLVWTQSNPKVDKRDSIDSVAVDARGKGNFLQTPVAGHQGEPSESKNIKSQELSNPMRSTSGNAVFQTPTVSGRTALQNDLLYALAFAPDFDALLQPDSGLLGGTHALKAKRWTQDPALPPQFEVNPSSGFVLREPKNTTSTRSSLMKQLLDDQL